MDVRKTPVSAHLAFGPAGSGGTGPTVLVDPRDTGVMGLLRGAARPRHLLAIVLGFYRTPLAWVGLLISMVILAYGGGAIMFWYHAVHLGEGGPAISHWQHWLLDSTAGFIGLAPALAVILPLATVASLPPGGAQAARTIRPVLYALAGGVMFALVTAPGPFLHDLLVGRGTWLADTVTEMWGNGQAPQAFAVPVSVPVELGRQIAVGLPTYIVLMGVALLAVRGFVRLGHSLSRSRV
ncbi:hypothetical protein GCM10022226_62670 [Sphaerisporangium flaviroseum]|uniref:DUF3995 domain-containing protein n=1 Tax=Sphaerisporangium flaviroseum TaxID=509199 RepID=A0ABP7J2A1_9ACTN